MNILFISKHKSPHIGGVEKHILEVSKNLKQKGHNIRIISEEDIKPPQIKILGLLYIWYWLFKNRHLIARCHLVHIHDVFIWYLPFRFLYPKKPVFITFHGWEGKYPIPMWNILNKRIAAKLSTGSIAVGKYIEKYYGIKVNKIIYGATTLIHINRVEKIKNSIVYLGRQGSDTGYLEFLDWLKIHGQKMKVKFINKSKNPEKFLRTAEFCVPSGYLSYLEAKSMDCKIMTFANNPLKVDYWNEVKKLKSIPTWEDITEIYLKLWNLY